MFLKSQTMTNLKLTLLAMLLPLAANAARVALPAPAPSPFADTEAATNGVVCAVDAADNRFSVSLELDAATNNCVLVEFGVDSDGSGTLERGEVEFSVGWDSGEWTYRDLVSGLCESAATASGRRRLEWTLSLNPDKSPKTLLARDGAAAVFRGAAPATFFNLAWNRVRVVRRGPGQATESASFGTSVAPMSIIVR